MNRFNRDKCVTPYSTGNLSYHPSLTRELHVAASSRSDREATWDAQTQMHLVDDDRDDERRQETTRLGRRS
jgi:hypothetical protein